MGDIAGKDDSRASEVRCLPDGDDGRKQDQEPEDVYVPQTTEAIESDERERQSERNRAQDLGSARN